MEDSDPPLDGRAVPVHWEAPPHKILGRSVQAFIG